jgi:hypothetical protein
MTETSPPVVATDVAGVRVPKVLRADASQFLAPAAPLCDEYLDVEYTQLCSTAVQGQMAGR